MSDVQAAVKTIVELNEEKMVLDIIYGEDVVFFWLKGKCLFSIDYENFRNATKKAVEAFAILRDEDEQQNIR